jgi:hypothetical protein
MLRRLSQAEIVAYIADARLEVVGAPRDTERNARATVIVSLADQLASLAAEGLAEKISKEIHLGEWCPERDKCSGRSAHSDAAARAALKVVLEHVAAVGGAS